MYSLIIAVSAFDGMNELGGHYFSALVTAKELKKEHKVCVLVIGDFIPKTLETNEVHLSFVKYRPGAFQIYPENVKATVRDVNPDIIIAFDEKSGSILRVLSATRKLGFIQVKAGGPIPRTPLQNNPFQVHFSQKDYDLARKRIRYKNRLIAWIPNRVKDEECDWPSIEELRQELRMADDEIVMIRIGRVDRKYERAFVAAINAANIMRYAGFKVRLIMIGAITHQDVARRLSECKNVNDVLLTDRKYTNNAKRFLSIAHINLGVGRGFMEGCAVGNHMLAMVDNRDLPVVVTEDNFHDLFAENFSLRGLSPIVDEQRKADLIGLANAVTAGSKISQQSLLWFKGYFDGKRLNELYRPVLDAAAKHKEKIDINVLVNAAVFMIKKFCDRRRWLRD